MAQLRGARASFLCVTETESMATVCPSSHSPVSGGHLHASDKRWAPNMCKGKSSVSIGAQSVECGGGCSKWVGEGWRGGGARMCRR